MNKTKILLILFILLPCLYVSSVSGISAGKEGMNSGVSSIRDIIDEIQKNQKVDNVFQIDPDKVSDRLLEKTGEAVMKNMPATQRLHEILDGLVVGNGLSSLTAVHRVMGYHYLKGDFYGGPGNLTNTGLVCNQENSKPAKSNLFINFSARYLAFLWFLIITLIFTNIYILFKLRHKSNLLNENNHL